MKTIKFLGVETPFRFLLFLSFGFLCGTIFFLSMTFLLSTFPEYGKMFRFFSLAFILIYPILWGLINHKDMRKIFLCGPDILFYIGGGIASFIVMIVLSTIFLFGYAMFHLIK
jgi:hypothetical protein